MHSSLQLRTASTSLQHFAIVELAEKTLLDLSFIDLLTCLRLNKHFNGIKKSSITIQQALFLAPVSGDTPREILPVQLSHIDYEDRGYQCDIYVYQFLRRGNKNQTWKRTFLTQPPIRSVAIIHEGPGQERFVLRGSGITLADVDRVAQEIMKDHRKTCEDCNMGCIVYYEHVDRLIQQRISNSIIEESKESA